MALTEELEQLAISIVPASPGLNPAQDAATVIAINNVKNLLEKVMTHVQDKGEINTELTLKLENIIGGGVPIGGDGGVGLQLTQVDFLNGLPPGTPQNAIDKNKSEGKIT